MKWSIAGLFALGIVAALAGVVVVVTLQPSARAAERDPAADAAEPEVEVLVAARELAPRAVVGSADVRVRRVPASAAPEAAFADPVQVVGRVLVLRMEEGQAFHPTSFASTGSGLLLASALAPGTRAVGITLQDDMGIEELLYPGCLVDVLARIQVDSHDGLGRQPMATTLLSGVMVLGVGRDTVVSAESQSGGVGQRRNRPTVTLLLDPEQAEKLKLAASEGSISLVMRSPVDADEGDGEGTTLAQLSPRIRAAQEHALERIRAEELARIAEERARQEEELASRREELERERAALEAERAQLAAAPPEPESESWESVVLRGGAKEARTFEVPREKRR